MTCVRSTAEWEFYVLIALWLEVLKKSVSSLDGLLFTFPRIRHYGPLKLKWKRRIYAGFSIMIQFEDDKFRIPKCSSEMKTTTRNMTEMKLNCRGDERCGWAESGRWKTLNPSSNLFATIFFSLFELFFSLSVCRIESSRIESNSRKLQLIAKSFTSWKMNSQKTIRGPNKLILVLLSVVCQRVR